VTVVSSIKATVLLYRIAFVMDEALATELVIVCQETRLHLQCAMTIISGSDTGSHPMCECRRQ
jgi:hypothetical protein